MSSRQIYSSNGIVQSDTAATANALVERDSDGSIYQSIARAASGVRSGGHVYEGVLTSQTVSFTVDETVGSKNATFYPCDATAGAIVVTLPAASGNSGKVVKVKKTDTSTNAVIIDGSSTETIDGALKFALYRQYQTIHLICDGSNWHVLSATPALVYAATAASTAVSNTTSETSFDNVTLSLAADTIRAGDTYEFEAQAIATSTTSSDTLTVKVKIGSTVIVTTGALDATNNDLAVIRGTITFRTAGASGTLVADGIQIIGAEGTAVKDWKLASTVVDTTAAMAITCTATWSASSASDSVRLDNFTMRRLS
jgi:hypothetical protein